MYHKERKTFPQINCAMLLIVKTPQVQRCENVGGKVVLELVKVIHTRNESKSHWKYAKRNRVQRLFYSPGAAVGLWDPP